MAMNAPETPDSSDPQETAADTTSPENPSPKGDGIFDDAEAGYAPAEIESAPDSDSVVEGKAALDPAMGRLQGRCDAFPKSRLTLRDTLDAHNLADWMGEVWDDAILHHVEKPENPRLFINQHTLSVLQILPDTEGQDQQQNVNPISPEIARSLLSQSSYWHKGLKFAPIIKGKHLGEDYSAEDYVAILSAIENHPGFPHGVAEFREAKPGEGKKKPPLPDVWGISYPVEVYPPTTVSRQFIAEPDQRTPALNFVSRRPQLNAKGTAIIAENGYHAADRIWMDYTGTIIVPKAKTPAEIARAAWLTISDVWGDFPFDGPASAANFISLLLTGVCGISIRKKPAFLIGKPESRTGASLLAESASLVLTGGYPARVSMSGGKISEDEIKKELVTAGLANNGMVLFDNLTGVLNSAAANSYLTSVIWKHRRLGGNEFAEIDRRHFIDVMTANNLMHTKETIGRCVNIRLDAKLADPGQRSDEVFKHPDLEDFCADNRDEILSAILDLMGCWVSRPAAWRAGRKAPLYLGGFESWRDPLWRMLLFTDSLLCKTTIPCAGCGDEVYPGLAESTVCGGCEQPEQDGRIGGEYRGQLRHFLGNQSDFDAFVTGDDDSTAEILAWLLDVFEDNEFTANDFLNRLSEMPDPDFAWGMAVMKAKKDQGRTIGNTLRRMQDRTVEMPGRKLVRLEATGNNKGNKRHYRVVSGKF